MTNTWRLPPWRQEKRPIAGWLLYLAALISISIAQAQAADAEPQQTAPGKGGVYLVSVGPGAPDLITVRAAEVLRRADRVFCYRWMKDELTPWVRPEVVEVASPLLRGGHYFGADPEKLSDDQRVEAGRAHGELARLKNRIRELTEQGKTVVFADNGDPMIFSPWSWVPAQLAEFDPIVVPGLSSFNAGNAAVKRSVAGRGYVILSSGIEMGSADANGRLAGTVVFFTHRRKLDSLLPTLRERYPADTPVAIVGDASYPAEKVVWGTLGSILDVLGEEELPHLYLFYVGDSLAEGACCR